MSSFSPAQFVCFRSFLLCLRGSRSLVHERLLPLVEKTCHEGISEEGAFRSGLQSLLALDSTVMPVIYGPSLHKPGGGYSPRPSGCRISWRIWVGKEKVPGVRPVSTFWKQYVRPFQPTELHRGLQPESDH